MSKVTIVRDEGRRLEGSFACFAGAVGGVRRSARRVVRRSSRSRRRCELSSLVAGKLTLKADGGVGAQVKVPALVAGMVAGADSIDDMDLLRPGGMDRLGTEVRAPSTLGTFLRCCTFGGVRQLDSIASAFLTRLAAAGPLLPGAQTVA